MNTVRIDPLTPETVQKYRSEIAEFYYQNLRECSCLEHYTYEQAYKKIGDFIDHLSSGTAIGYGVFQEDDICGYIWAYPHPFREEQRMYINELHIREDYRNKGLGNALLSAVEEKAKVLGISTLYIHAEANNCAAIGLYETCGYKEERIQLNKRLDTKIV